MLPREHAIVSTSLGAACWLWTGNPGAGAAAMAAGILPDVDHIVDYLIYRSSGKHRLVLPMHGYEFALVGGAVALLAGSEVIGVAALSYLIHLLLDQSFNHTRKPGYFLLYRLWHRFRIDEISLMPEAATRGREEDMQGIKHLLATWSRRLSFVDQKTS